LEICAAHFLNSQRALAIREKALGPDHDNEALLQATATSLNNLAWLFYNERFG